LNCNHHISQLVQGLGYWDGCLVPKIKRVGKEVIPDLPLIFISVQPSKLHMVKESVEGGGGVGA